jgi:3-isopropylmalate dehydrogenase
MNEYKITLMPGDGIGPEILSEAVKVLGAVSEVYGHRFEFREALVGGASIEQHGTALTEETLEIARKSDAVLFGAVGDPKYDDPGREVRPEQALLALREGLGLFANIRPAKVFSQVVDESPLKPERVTGTDIVVVRELTGGIYFGKPKKRWTSQSGRQAVDSMTYSEHEVERILHVAFKMARKRRKLVTSVDKANVLDTSRMWREIAGEVAAGYPDVAFENILVDACAMHLINKPTRFDVIVTENMFGDILTDEAAMIMGSLGMMPSASLGARDDDNTCFGLYEPAHGSAPDIAGRDIANPIGMIMSAAMMLRLSFGLSKEAESLEEAVEGVLESGLRTSDLVRAGEEAVSTSEMGAEIVRRLKARKAE